MGQNSATLPLAGQPGNWIKLLAINFQRAGAAALRPLIFIIDSMSMSKLFSDAAQTAVGTMAKKTRSLARKAGTPPRKGPFVVKTSGHHYVVKGSGFGDPGYLARYRTDAKANEAAKHDAIMRALTAGILDGMAAPITVLANPKPVWASPLLKTIRKTARSKSDLRHCAFEAAALRHK